MRQAPIEMALLPQQMITGSGTGPTKSVGFYEELLVYLELPALTGTGVSLNVFVDSSDDGGQTWHNLKSARPRSDGA